jgi:hypothetical protein
LPARTAASVLANKDIALESGRLVSFIPGAAITAPLIVSPDDHQLHVPGRVLAMRSGAFDPLPVAPLSKERGKEIMRIWSVGLILLAGILFLAYRATLTTPAERHNNIDAMRQLYSRIARVPPSKVGSAGFTQAIQDRVACYERSPTPLERFDTCSTPYVNAIIRNARRYVESKPELGLFIGAVQYCPIIYSMCTGQSQDRAFCIMMERQCIDATLDKYWRGVDSSPTRE